MYGSVEVGGDFVQIFDENDFELLYWDQQEWVDDPSVALVIAQAVKDVYTIPMEELKQVEPWKSAYEEALLETEEEFPTYHDAQGGEHAEY